MLLECPPGPWIPRFAPGFKRTWVQNSWVQSHALNAEDTREAGLAQVECALSDFPQAKQGLGIFDTVLYRLQKEGAKNLAALYSAFEHLELNGKLYVTGRNDEGIKSLTTKGEAIFGNSQTLHIKSSSRVLQFQKTAASPITPDDNGYFETLMHTVDALRTGKFTYRTRPGLFAYRATDPATELLLQHLPDCRDLRVADLACGAGLLGLAAYRSGAKWVGALDAAISAVEMTQLNFSEQRFPGEALCADLSEHSFVDCDLVLTNPPFHSGKDVDFSFPRKVLAAAARALASRGEAWLVANAFLPYPRLSAGYFRECELVEKRNGFGLYRLRFPITNALEFT